MTYPHFLHPLLLITDYILIIRISMAFIQCLLHAHFCVFSHQNCHHFNPYPPVTYGDGALTEVTHGPCHVPCFTAWHCVALRHRIHFSALSARLPSHQWPQALWLRYWAAANVEGEPAAWFSQRKEWYVGWWCHACHGQVT